MNQRKHDGLFSRIEKFYFAKHVFIYSCTLLNQHLY